MLIFEGKEIETDTEGYLKESSQWSEPLAVVIAENEGITLSPEHWEVVRFVRDFYLEFNTSPAIRMLVKAMANKFGEEKGNSRYLYRLFPKGPAKQATKIAGLPKPVNAFNGYENPLTPGGMMRLAEHPFHTRRTRAATLTTALIFPPALLHRRQPLPRCHRQDFWRTRLVPVFSLRTAWCSGILRPELARKPRQLCRLSTLLLSLSLMDALQIHGKLRTMTPISLHRQKSKL